METYLARPKLRTDANKTLIKGQMRNHLSKWLHELLDEITKDMCVSSHKRIVKSGKRGAHLTVPKAQQWRLSGTQNRPQSLA